MEIPSGIREVIWRRIARLSQHCARTLEMAAVAGAELRLWLVARLIEEPDDQLAADLEEAVAANGRNANTLRTRARSSRGRSPDCSSSRPGSWRCPTSPPVTWRSPGPSNL